MSSKSTRVTDSRQKLSAEKSTDLSWTASSQVTLITTNY